MVVNGDAASQTSRWNRRGKFCCLAFVADICAFLALLLIIVSTGFLLWKVWWVVRCAYDFFWNAGRFFVMARFFPICWINVIFFRFGYLLIEDRSGQDAAGGAVLVGQFVPPSSKVIVTDIWMILWLIDWSIDRLIDWSLHWSLHWLFAWLIDWSWAWPQTDFENFGVKMFLSTSWVHEK